MNDPAPVKIWNEFDRPHRDLREFLSRIERAGELLTVPGAHWNLEMGALAESVNERPNAPAVLFEDVPEYPRGFRVLSGSTNSMRRLAITLGFPVPGHPLDVVRAYRDRMKTHRPIPPRVVRDGPVLENILPEGKLDVLKFPVPFRNELRFGLSEYDYAGGHRGEPFEVIESELYRLPLPAHAEIVLEGEMVPGDVAPEGPFGEFTGYYAGGKSEQPVIRVQRVYHRNDPILTMATPMRPPSDFSYSKCVMKAGMIWDEVERAGLSGVKGVWCHEAGGARMFNVIAIKQAYAGHAKQAALAAASCQSGSYLGRFIVAVDDDIDPTNLFEVLWAMCTRCDPAEDIDIIRKMWSGPLDPRIARGTTWNSRFDRRVP